VCQDCVWLTQHKIWHAALRAAVGLVKACRVVLLQKLPLQLRATHAASCPLGTLCGSLQRPARCHMLCCAAVLPPRLPQRRAQLAQSELPCCPVR
jgi:hypothetical protein